MAWRKLTSILAVVSLSGCSLFADDPLDAGQAAFEAQDFDAARAEAQLVLAENPNDVPALELLARTQLAMGQGADAIITLDRLQSIGGLPEDARLIEAEALLQMGAPDDALLLLEDETSADSWRLRALAARLAGDEQGAMAAFSQGRAASGDKFHLYVAEASFHLDRRDPDTARAPIALAQQLDPDRIETLFISARLAQFDGEPALAARAFLAILTIAPNDRPALLGAIAALEAIDRQDLSRQLVAQGRAAYPGDVEFLYLTARIHADERNWAAARMLLQDNEASVSRHPQARGLYGRALLELGQVELARAQIEPLYRRDPANPEFAQTYARILQALDENADAPG